MDEWTLNDLLECSVCLERLDTSSKVLPCQHTFCKKCLEEIVSTQKELRCPECRILVDVKIDELPPNVLLMRILEGMRNCGLNKNHGSNKESIVTLTPASPQTSTVLSTPKPHSQNELKLTNKTVNPPCARAVYDYLSKEPGDLSFKKGDIVLLRKKIDNNWYQGECSGQVGAFPISYVQVMGPLPKYVSQCKALYDFRMRSDDEEGCLTFNKGDVITVLRRVDDNWAEGRIEDQVGIFPLAFVELNSVARALIKWSSSSEPGTSRVAPPTPSNEATPLIMNIDLPSVKQQPVQNPGTNTGYSITGTDTSSSSLTSPSSSSTTPTSSSTPSSPASPPLVSAPPPPNKRHSFGSLHSNSHQLTSNRHSAEILSPPEISQPQSLPSDLLASQQVVPLQRQSSQRHRRYGSSEIAPIPGPQISHSTLHLPASYVALYPYKPQKADELELKRGAVYTVTERCQDGWFKGTSARNQKSGVFPGNYVAPAKSLPALQAQVKGLCRNSPNSGAIRTPAPPLEPRSSVSYTRPSPRHQGSSAIENSSLRNSSQINEHPSTAVIAPPNVSVQATCAALKATIIEKNRDKKEKAVSLMRRLTSIKKSKSPPPISYSMDNPVFEDLSAPPQGVHMRSGSCPNQLLTISPSEVQSHRLFSPSSSHKSKHKERLSASHIPSRAGMDGGLLVGGESNHRKSHSIDGSATSSSETSIMTPMSHQTKASQLPLHAKERFRCVVPYPPNSEYELELKLGDIIYVHKKRDDGWYKGTQQRTGRTGLFPASFVQSF